MPRGRAIDLSAYEQDLRQLYQDGSSLHDIVQWCTANIPNPPSQRTVRRRLRDWGLVNHRETAPGEQLNQRITELFLRNGLRDERILPILESEGFTITPRGLARIRREQGLRRRTNQPNEQEQQLNHALQLLNHAYSTGTFNDRMGMGFLHTDFRLQGLVMPSHRFRAAHREFRPAQHENRQRPRRGQARYRGPNDIWCIDQYEKLAAFGFEGYCCVDAYSRFVIWGFIGHVSTTALSTLKQYLRCLQDTEIRPRRIRADRGKETRLICRAHYHLCVHSLRQYPHQYENGEDVEMLDPAEVFLYGPSRFNHRSERWWGVMSDAHIARYRVSPTLSQNDLLLS